MDNKEVNQLKKEIRALHSALNNVLALLVQSRGLGDFDSDEYQTIVEGLVALAKHRELPTRMFLIEEIDKLIAKGEIKG